MLGVVPWQQAKGSSSVASLVLENARLFRKAEEATRSRDEMMAVLAHDLSNALFSFRLHAQSGLSRGGAQVAAMPSRPGGRSPIVPSFVNVPSPSIAYSSTVPVTPVSP